MGEQSPARHRHRWRDGLGDDAERLGRDLARAEKNYQVDRRHRRHWHTNAEKTKISASQGIPNFARELCAVVPHAVPDGSREPLSDVWKIEERLPQRTRRERRGTQGKTDFL